MIVTRCQVRPFRKIVKDIQATSANRAVLQMNVQFTIIGFISGEQSLEPSVASLTNSLYVRCPNTNIMQPFREPDLTPIAYAFYTRASYISGCDYTPLPVAVYDWKLAGSYHEFDANTQTYQTWYTISGRWHRYVGLFYNVAKKVN